MAWCKANTIQNSSDILVTQTSSGTVLTVSDRIKKKIGGNPTVSSGIGGFNYRGAWTTTPPTPYMINDVVQVGSGVSSGMYLSMLDNNTNYPDMNIGWIQLSSTNGNWF